MSVQDQINDIIHGRISLGENPLGFFAGNAYRNTKIKKKTLFTYNTIPSTSRDYLGFEKKNVQNETIIRRYKLDP